MIRLVWRSSFECGNPLIDNQHQDIFVVCNDLLDSIVANKSKGEVEFLLDLIHEDIIQHFQTEETLLEQMDHPISSEHIQLHRSLLQKTNTLISLYKSNSLGVGQLFEFISHEIDSDANRQRR